ncbi:carboxylesterase 1F-like [Neocloeon triangulifer]|uniref:carboxylesterase 1F-like n=1 Tax=Neocloeon triangulifer TaxID=2078957 RepID=UPI00286F5B50|nr:carboxylesterase 1F-like [Neocloeon triangulifer]
MARLRQLCSQICLGLLILGVNGQSPTVTLDNLGTLIGKEMTTIKGRIIHGFQGIPYGETTAGANRFQPPIPKQWSGTLDATNPGAMCIQPDLGVLRHQPGAPITFEGGRIATIGSEDCLVLHVYTPDLLHNKNLPVLVYYHGGGFLNGDERDFRPDHLLDQEVILVVPHYRLGPLGYLSMQNDLIPGNAGLLDSVEVLRWIQLHISKFGGDPNRVTVSGQSTGSTLSHYMMITPLTDGIVHGAIMMSGSTLTSLAYDRTPLKSARDIASFANCPVGTDDEVTQCLLNLSPEVLVDAHVNYYSAGGIGGTQPVISRPDEPAETKVLPDDPKVIVQSSNYKAVPMLAGATRHDSMFYVNTLDVVLTALNLTENELFIRKLLAREVIEFAGIVDTTGSISDMTDSKYLSYVTTEQRGNYTALIPGLLDILSTEFMKAPAYRIVQINSRRADSYLYTFSYRGRYHIPGNGINYPPTLFEDGVPHSDDMIYLTPRISDPFNAEELGMVNVLTTLWSNFVTTGNPNLPVQLGLPQWPKYDLAQESYYEINTASIAKQDYTEEFLVAIYDNLPYSKAAGRQ